MYDKYPRVGTPNGTASEINVKMASTPAWAAAMAGAANQIEALCSAVNGVVDRCLGPRPETSSKDAFPPAAVGGALGELEQVFNSLYQRTSYALNQIERLREQLP